MRFDMMESEENSGGLGRVWLVAFAVWIVLSALICWFYPLMVFDSIARYVPMADAFARGEWRLAFHPRFGVIFPPLTGALVWLFGIGGDKACQIVSTAFLAFSAVPVWAIAKRVFKENRVAWVATLLLLIATEYLTYAEDGLRDTGRTLGLAHCALAFVTRGKMPRPRNGIVSCDDRRRGILPRVGEGAIMALGILVLSVIKVDLYAFSCVLLAVWCVRSFWYRAWFALVLPILGWTLGTLTMCWMTYAQTGYFLPMAQFVKLYLKLTGGAL